MSFRRSNTTASARPGQRVLRALLFAAAGAITVSFDLAAAQVTVEPSEGVVVNIADRGLSKKVMIGAAKLVRVGPVSRVQITISNSGSSPVDIQYIAQWMDADGFEIPSNNRWEPARIDAFTDANISLLGTSQQAANVIVILKSQ